MYEDVADKFITGNTMTAIPDPNPAETAVDLAAKLLDTAATFLSPGEKRFQKQMAALLSHADDKAFLTELIDQCFRTKDPGRAGEQISYLFKKHGIPSKKEKNRCKPRSEHPPAPPARPAPRSPRKARGQG